VPGATPLTTPAGPGYPEELAQDVTLADGARIHLRPIRPDDQESLISFHDRLSSQTAYQRCSDCKNEAVCGVHLAMKEVRDATARILDHTSLATLQRKVRRASGA